MWHSAPRAGASPRTPLALAAAAALALTAGCADGTGPTAPPAAAPRAAVVRNDRAPFTVEATNPCNGEALVLRGEFHLLITDQTSESGNTVFHAHVNAEGRGVGSLGNEYVANGSANVLLHQKAGEPTAVGHAIAHLHVIGRGQVPDFFAHVNVRFEFNPATGQVVVTREQVRVECHR